MAPRRSPMVAAVVGAVVGAALAGGCGASPATPRTAQSVTTPKRQRATPRLARHAQGRPTTPAPVALVTAQTENQLLMVSLPGGRVIRRVPVPGDPGYSPPSAREVRSPWSAPGPGP